MGISEGEFWKLNIRKLRPYLIAEDMKREKENYMLWLQGIYFMKAVNVVVGNALAKRGSKPLEYFKEPVRITPYTKEELEQQKRDALKHTIEVLNSWKGKEDKNNG